MEEKLELEDFTANMIRKTEAFGEWFADWRLHLGDLYDINGPRTFEDWTDDMALFATLNRFGMAGVFFRDWPEPLMKFVREVLETSGVRPFAVLTPEGNFHFVACIEPTIGVAVEPSDVIRAWKEPSGDMWDKFVKEIAGAINKACLHTDEFIEKMEEMEAENPEHCGRCMSGDRTIN